MRVQIVGAGMAGLLAANMIRDHVVYEEQEALPNNHSAVLRFRTNIVGDVLNIPFKKVKMVKSYLPFSNPVTDALLYSMKTSDTIRSDRSIIDGTVVGDRFIAPEDLISRMAEVATIELGKPYNFRGRPNTAPVISTVPMPILMKALGFPHKEDLFQYRHGYSLRAKVHDCDAYCSLLIPSHEYKFYRISITGNELIVELSTSSSEVITQTYGELMASKAVNLLGIGSKLISDIRVIRQRYAKIVPIDDDIRKEFMHWATDQFGIFSLGRFATWRPGLLLDDLVNDVRLIDRWIKKGNRYDVARHR